MTYTTEELERQFKNTGRARKLNKKYSNDAGYWDGGRCNWGGGHSLKEDCQTLSNSFTKIESLREIKAELQKCTSKSEYDAKKSNYIRKCEESINGLQNKSASSSMFGVCCIWSDEGMDKHVISKLTNFLESLNKLKGDLEKESYKWVKEIKQLKLERKQIEKKIEENQKKANDKNIDPAEKALLLQLIEDDKKKLKSNLEKQKEIDSKFNFDPDKHISDLLEKIKKAIEKKDKFPKKPKDANRDNQDSSSDSESDDNSVNENNDSNNNGANNQPKKEDKKDWFEENKQLILIGGSALLIILYLYSQSDQETLEPNNLYHYNF